MSLSAVKAATAKNPINNFSFLSHETDVRGMRNVWARWGKSEMPHATCREAGYPLNMQRPWQQKNSPWDKALQLTHYNSTKNSTRFSSLPCDSIRFDFDWHSINISNVQLFFNCIDLRWAFIQLVYLLYTIKSATSNDNKIFDNMFQC